MSKKEKRVIKGFNVDRATEDQLNDLNAYELIDIILFFREQLQRYKQAMEEIKEIVIDFENSYGTDYKEINKIIQKCEEVNK